MTRLPTIVEDRLPSAVLNNLHEFKYFVKFLVVGASGAFVDLGTLFVLRTLVWPDAEVFDTFKYLAVTIAFIAAVVNNYTWNILWTYNHQDHSDQHHRTLSKFIIVSVMGLLINYVVIYLVHDLIDFSLLVGKLSAMGVVLFWNFFVNRFWTFKD